MKAAQDVNKLDDTISRLQDDSDDMKAPNTLRQTDSMFLLNDGKKFM